MVDTIWRQDRVTHVPNALAVVMTRPQQLELREVALRHADAGEVLVDVQWTGISTGTERLLFTGRMPPFPGMGYPLVPGYETVGTVVEAPADSDLSPGDSVFVPGANCFVDVRGLFGGAASRLRVPAARLTKIDAALGERGVLLALAATARHALAKGPLPSLIVGHGVLGRLLARLTVAAGGQPVVWETDARRQEGAVGYTVVTPDDDPRRDHACICDVSGDATLLDTLVGRIARGGSIVLAGFYADRLGFDFPMAFIKEASFRIAAEWKPEDLAAVVELVDAGRLDLDGLITHQRRPAEIEDAYGVAFEDPTCLKMLVDWRASA